MNSAELPDDPVKLTAQFATTESKTQALVLYGPRMAGKSSLLRNLVNNITQRNRFIPVLLSVRDNLDYSRAEVLYDLAARMVETAGLPHDLLDDFSPNNFHKAFLERLLQAIPQSSKLLFVFDDIDLSDRVQLSKLNNLILPLLRRLAPLDRLKFILAVDDVNPEKIRTLVQPIFTNIEELGLKVPDSQIILDEDAPTPLPAVPAENAEPTEDAVYSPFADIVTSAKMEQEQIDHSVEEDEEPTEPIYSPFVDIMASVQMDEEQPTSPAEEDDEPLEPIYSPFADIVQPEPMRRRPVRVTPLGGRQRAYMHSTNSEQAPDFNFNHPVDFAVEEHQEFDLLHSKQGLPIEEEDNPLDNVLLLVLLIVVIGFLLFNIWLLLPMLTDR
ncbi:MAG: ATP-binding protein [Chloroflexota bacterium]